MLWFIIGILCVAVDRLSKMYIANNFMTGQSVPVINRVFHITYHLNDGAAFSVLSGKTVFLTVISLVIMAAIAAYNKKTEKQFTSSVADIYFVRCDGEFYRQGCKRRCC